MDTTKLLLFISRQSINQVHILSFEYNLEQKWTASNPRWTYREVLLALPSWLEQYHLAWTRRKKPFCLVLESERFRSQDSKGQHARAGFPISTSGTCKRRWSFWLCYSPKKNDLVIEILRSREGKLNDQVPSRCKSHICVEGSCFLHEWGG